MDGASSDGDFAVAVAEFLDLHSRFIEEGEVEIGEWGGFVKADVAAAFHRSGGATGDDDGEVLVVVDVGVSHAAAIHDEGVIQQGAFTIGGGFHFLQELSEEGDVKGIDLRHALDRNR